MAAQPHPELRSSAVGPWPMNAYALVCPTTRRSVLIDPGADPEALAGLVAGTTPVAILLTHTHGDHIGALDDMRASLQVPVIAHPGPYVAGVQLQPDRTLSDGERIQLGECTLIARFTPGHTADMISYIALPLYQVVVGDTLFEGGPGRTWSMQDFRTTLETLRDVILTWPDESELFPGHGPSFRLADRRAAIEAFLRRDHGEFFGDATWT
jgi:glyoxylase-like metal-dependent hydrolase (beta-lactamase superfamily II)